MANAIGSLYKRTDMDTTKIDEFIHYLQEYYIIEQRISKNHTYAHSVKLALLDKYDAFENCTHELCVEHGENITIILLSYRDKLKDFLTLINKEIDYYRQSDKKKNHIYYYVIGCLKSFLVKCSQAIKHLDRLLGYYGVKTEVAHDNTETGIMTIGYSTVGTQNLNNEITTIIDDVHYTTSFSDKTLEKVYDYLIKRGCLHPETLLSDFIYYFTGRGEKVNNGLKWDSEIGGKVKLAYFINTIIKGGRDQDKSYWKKAEIIFGVSALGNSYSRSSSNKDNSSNEQLQEDIKKLLK